MRVIKIGGGCLNGKTTIQTIMELLSDHGKGNVIVVSALKGITDFLIESMQQALVDESMIPDIMARYRTRHAEVGRHLIQDKQSRRLCKETLAGSFSQLERLLYGLSFTREITPRLYDTIVSFGERTCAELLAAVMNSRGIESVAAMPQKIGLITDGKFGDATVAPKKTAANFRRHLKAPLKTGVIVFMPGFFGVGPTGDITTFGRGGSDYSAAVAAGALEAECLEIWKDVDGFMSADPKNRSRIPANSRAFVRGSRRTGLFRGQDSPSPNHGTGPASKNSRHDSQYGQARYRRNPHLCKKPAASQCDQKRGL